MFINYNVILYTSVTFTCYNHDIIEVKLLARRLPSTFGWREASERLSERCGAAQASAVNELTLTNAPFGIVRGKTGGLARRRPTRRRPIASLRATACCRFGGNRGPVVLPNGRLVSSRRFQRDLLRFPSSPSSPSRVEGWIPKYMQRSLQPTNRWLVTKDRVPA